MPKYFIVDDHPVVREGLKALIRSIPGLECCGEAGDAGQALEDVARLDPDLIVLDLELPGLHGLELLRRLEPRRRQVIVLTLHDQEEMRLAAMAAGAYAFVGKADQMENLTQLVRNALGLADPALSQRERDILRLVGDGHTSRQIAQLLSISYHTVESHRSNIARKLNLEKRSEMLRYALQNRHN